MRRMLGGRKTHRDGLEIAGTASDMVLTASRADGRAPWVRKMPRCGPPCLEAERPALKLQAVSVQGLRIQGLVQRFRKQIGRKMR